MLNNCLSKVINSCECNRRTLKQQEEEEDFQTKDSITSFWSSVAMYTTFNFLSLVFLIPTLKCTFEREADTD
jgi:hypothetical protein